MDTQTHTVIELSPLSHSSVSLCKRRLQMLWVWCLFFQARSMCVCVFSCVQCSTDARSALQLGRGLWPRPKQKATVVSLQIACSEYHSTTEANEEERHWMGSDGKTDGIYQAIERRACWLWVHEAPQKWSTGLRVFPKLQVRTKDRSRPCSCPRPEREMVCRVAEEFLC